MLIFVAASMLGGCTFPQFGKTAKIIDQTPKESADEIAARSFSQSCTYDQEVCKYYTAMMTIYSRPLVITSTSSVKELGKAVSVVKMDGKGNLEMTSVRDDKEESALITLDKVVYFKDIATNTWHKNSTENNTMQNDASVFDPTTMVNNFKREAQVSAAKMVITKLGEESCGEAASQLTCLKYQMDEPDLDTRTTVWFDRGEYKARKIETVYDSMTVVTTYTYGDVTISQPSPIQEATETAEQPSEMISLPSGGN